MSNNIISFSYIHVNYVIAFVKYKRYWMYIRQRKLIKFPKFGKRKYFDFLFEESWNASRSADILNWLLIGVQCYFQHFLLLWVISFYRCPKKTTILIGRKTDNWQHWPSSVSSFFLLYNRYELRTSFLFWWMPYRVCWLFWLIDLYW